MTFKKIAMEASTFTLANLKTVQKILKKQYNSKSIPMQDIIKNKRNNRRNKDLVVRDLVTALCVCHNVTPIVEEEKRSFQASSPDEIALVEISELMGVKLVSRNAD